MITMRPFTKFDWYGMCDAQRFDDGSAPLIGELVLAEKRFSIVVVLDGMGLGVCITDVDGDDDDSAFASCGDTFISFEGAFAARALASLRNGMSLVELVALPGCTGLDEDDVSTLTMRGAA